jgi:Ca2+-binding EF-hand superfamily protein
MERSVYVREENMRKAFAHFDQDHDGKITMLDLVDAMGR